jgi:shikimate dehydrogenase
MAIVRLIGEHISYSASPAMQSAAFAALGLEHTYELADVPPARLHGMVRLLRSRSFLGANVTVPYKRDVIADLNQIDEVAKRAGAVNTITKVGGRLLGFNTDIPAIADEIHRLRSAPRAAVILGAGGAARAVAIALSEMAAAEPVMVSRATWSDLPRLLATADLLVNATPVGTNSDESPIDQRLLHPNLAVLDLVYRPSPTRLVREARECGLPARAGAGVLLGQGWRSLEAWLGRPVPEHVKAAMADALRRELGEGADV